jgi:hypothetical protein
MRPLIFVAVIASAAVATTPNGASSQSSPAFLLQDGSCIDFSRNSAGTIFASTINCLEDGSAFRIASNNSNRWTAIGAGGICLRSYEGRLILDQCDSGRWQWKVYRSGEYYVIFNTLDELCLTRSKTMASQNTAVSLAQCQNRWAQGWEIGSP